MVIQTVTLLYNFMSLLVASVYAMDTRVSFPLNEKFDRDYFHAHSMYKLNRYPRSDANSSQEAATPPLEKEAWIKGSIDRELDDMLRMHAFIVKDDDVSVCPQEVDRFLMERYYMCSGVILSARHVLTTASCLNMAEVYESHIEGDIVVLVGAMKDTGYVLQILSVTKHPKFNSNPSSEHYEQFNLAIITLQCEIPKEFVFVPRLPTNEYQDAPHMCCPDRCKLLTVIEDVDNQHQVQLMKLKYLPLPLHHEEFPIKRSFPMRGIRKIPKTGPGELSRKVRTPGKAPPPDFGDKDKDSKKGKMTFEETLGDAQKKHSQSKQSPTSTGDPEDKKAIESEADKIVTKLPTLDWESMLPEIKTDSLSLAHRDEVKNYFNVLIEEMLRDLKKGGLLLDLVQSFVNGIKNFNSDQFGEIKREAAILAVSLVRRPLKDALESIDQQIRKLQNADSEEAPEDKTPDTGPEGPLDFIYKRYEECPPEGSPIIVNNTLVAIIAYTCEDIQPTTPWRYADVALRANWICGVMRMSPENSPQNP